MYSWRILIDHEYESDGHVDTNFILNDTVFLAVSRCRETHYLWQYLLNVVKFDTGFNYYARFGQPCFIRSSSTPYQYAGFHQLPNVQCNSRLIDECPSVSLKNHTSPEKFAFSRLVQRLYGAFGFIVVDTYKVAVQKNFRQLSFW